MNEIDKFISSYSDWRGATLFKLRELIAKSTPDLTESMKWGVPVWEYKGLVCAISGFKDHVKINFFKGAYLDDPKSVFNSGLDSKDHRSINLTSTDKLDETAIKELIKAAVAYNQK